MFSQTILLRDVGHHSVQVKDIGLDINNPLKVLNIPIKIYCTNAYI